MPNSKSKQGEKAKGSQENAHPRPDTQTNNNDGTYRFFKDDTTDLLQALEEDILLFLDADDLWNCLKVSKRLNALITASSKLQLLLRTDLHCLSMPPMDLPSDVWGLPRTSAAEQVAAIIRNQRALDLAQPTATKCVDRPRTAVHSVSEGFMFMTETLDDRKAWAHWDAYSVWQLPTGTGDLKGRPPAPFAGAQWNSMWMWRWHVGEVFIASAICVEDNVVAIATEPFRPKSSVSDGDDERVLIQRIYFFPLFPSTGSLFEDKPPPHPECAMPFIDITVPNMQNRTYELVMSLAPGGILGVFMGDYDGRDSFSLNCWNWKRGEALGARPALGGRVSSFVLLNNLVITSVIVSEGDNRIRKLTPILEIWDFCAPIPLSPRPQIVTTLPDDDCSVHFLQVIACLALPSMLMPTELPSLQSLLGAEQTSAHQIFIPLDFRVELGQSTTTNTRSNLITFCLPSGTFSVPQHHRTVTGVFSHASLDMVVADCRRLRVENNLSNHQATIVPWDRWDTCVHLLDDPSKKGSSAAGTRLVQVTSLEQPCIVQITDFNTHKGRSRAASTTRRVSKNCPVGLTRAGCRDYFFSRTLSMSTTRSFDCPQTTPLSAPNIVVFGAGTLEAQRHVLDDGGRGLVSGGEPIRDVYRAQSESTVKLAWEGSDPGNKVEATFFNGTHLVLQTGNGHIIILFFN